MMNGPRSGANDEAIEVRQAQIALVLKQAEDGTSISEVCRKPGISEVTFYAWRKKYAGLMPREMWRLRQFEDENGKLKRLVADLSLDKAMLQDVVSRKLYGLTGVGSLSMRFGALGRSASGGLVACFEQNAQATTIVGGRGSRPS
jgi:putative transposase